MPEPVVVDTRKSPHAALRPVPVNAVRFSDHFWLPRLEMLRRRTLPGQFAQCEQTGRFDRFRIAAGQKTGKISGPVFNDSDIYKLIEAASWSMASANPSPADASLSGDLAAEVNRAIALIAAAQQPDGYLNTAFMFDRAARRYSNLKDDHELYCAGHLFQAAVAHYRTTGSHALLEVATRLADHLCRTFGSATEGKRPQVDGHPEVEMALIELGRTTGNAQYIALAEYFLRARGHGLAGGNAYHQDHVPLVKLQRMVGHAVRAVYLNCGAADLLAEQADPALQQALERMWQNMTQRQWYITGGIGPRHEGEAFGDDFELPGARAYAETCAAIGSVMWAWRMLLLSGDGRYADALEQTLYNGVLAGLSLQGDTYFYVNPLADDGTHRRQGWFGCACCPPNIARLLASLSGYVYTTTDDAIQVHLYAAGSAAIRLAGGREVVIEQQTAYPADGLVHLAVRSGGTFSLALRIPAWARGATVAVNGVAAEIACVPGTYARLSRTWQAGDTVTLALPMPVERRYGHPHAAELLHRVALQRGPLVYCAEAADNPGIDLRDLILPDDAPITPTAHALLGEVPALQGPARVVSTPPEQPLYANQPSRPIAAACTITAIPYFAWGNREAGQMQVWLRRE